MQKHSVSETILFDQINLVSVPTALYLLLWWRVAYVSQSEGSLQHFVLSFEDRHPSTLHTNLYFDLTEKKNLHYRHRPVNVLYGNNHCLLWESQATYKFCGRIQTSECCGSWHRFLPLNFKRCILSVCIQLAARAATLSFPPLLPSLSQKFGCNVFTFFDFK